MREIVIRSIFHVLGGVIVFAVIAGIAIGLNIGVHAVAKKLPDVDAIVISVVVLAEWLLLLADLVLFSIFLVGAILKFKLEIDEWRKQLG